MSGDDATTLAVKFRNEGEALRKQAAADLKAAEQERAHAERRHRDVAELEANITRREAKLKELGEPQLLAREKAAAKALADAQQLMKAYDRDRHAAAIALQQINEREKAEAAA